MRKDGYDRSLSLEPGPPYVSIQADDKDDARVFGRNSMTDTGDSPRKYSVHGSKYTSSQGSLWLQRGVFIGSNQPGSAGSGSLEKVFLLPADQNPKVEDDDSFLVPPSRVTTTRTATTEIPISGRERGALQFTQK